MHKYKKGDRVKIKSELWYLLNKDDDGIVYNMIMSINYIICKVIKFIKSKIKQ